MSIAATSSPAAAPFSGGGITQAGVYETIGATTSAKEANLKRTLSGLGENASTSDLLLMQKEIQEWGLFTQIQSTIVKEVSEAMKGVIQKAA